MSQRPSVLVHIVTWNSAESIVACLERLYAQEGFTLGDNLFIRVTDNASSDETVALVEGVYRSGVSLHKNRDNLGFCAAHNQGVQEFLKAEYTALLILNPDVGLESAAVRTMVERLSAQERIGLITPKLYRALPSLEAIYPNVLDAAGMRLTRSCRHFDRGAGDWDRHQFERGEFVFGGTGACLMISRECALDLCIPASISNEEVFTVYPQLRDGSRDRPQLFDEAFFAYREDADLCWRAKRRRWKCWYEPTAQGNHVRVVTPERRASLPALLNRYSVRNRFLLQMNNWRLRDGLIFFVWGIIIRNIIVIVGVLVWEKTSIEGLREARSLSKRAFAIRRWLASSNRKV
jgi:GT2 family glycosyltransferase